MPDPENKVDESTNEKTVTPGETGEDGKYTDEGLAALVDKISKGETSEETSKGASEETSEENDEKTEQMIPISRFNEVINERNKLRDQLSQSSRPSQESTQQNAQPTVQELRGSLSEKRAAWQEALLENEPEKAKALLKEIDALEVEIDEARIAESEMSTRAASADDIRYDNLLEQYQKEYPVINKDSDQFDQKVVTEVFEVREAFIARGLPWSKALQKAHDLVLKPLKAAKTVEETTTSRKADSKRNLADALTRQPASVSDVGASSDSIGNNKFGIDIKRLTVDQFDKLPEDIKAQLRGDTLEKHHVDSR